ncbi:BTAD domain-containing putative transcriptional regulator [Frankia sp. Cr2]|uniref:BTAD domain-containing putative transcriptional regulator n=1 Tax=Frankia sp. Cr2 TaxID=3073932 RepID=UPI002AD41A35|nr:BTAD domain-containing putative transcriptional regulator [Frankia sp. Cr2]
MSILVRLLGPVDVTVEGSVRPVPGLRRKAVLARLALRPGEVVSVDQLIDAVWDGRPPATAVNSLQSHVSYLRRVLGASDAIRAKAPGYVLGALATDLRRAEKLIGQGRGAADPAEGLAVLEQALDLWRGQPLVDVAELSWFAQEADRLEQMWRVAEQAAVEYRLAFGQHATLVPELAKRSDLVKLIDSYRNETTGTSVGGLILQAGLAVHDMHQNRREEAERRALSVLAADRLIGHPMAEPPMACAWAALVPCDSPALLPSVETALEHSRRAGSLRGLAPSFHYRSEVMYAQGYLTDALSDARRAWEAAEYGTIGLGQAFIADILLKTLVARGEIDQAGEVLRQIKARHASGVTPTLFAPGEIALYLATGQTQRALATALATRDECAASPWVNPMGRDWRAPLVRCYRLLGRDDEARAAAEGLLAVSTEWGTPRAVGRALRHAATVESRTRELELLEESVRLLEGTSANLERARSLYAFGEALIRSGRPADARSRLGTALDLAAFCDARPLQDAIGSAIRRAGGRPLPSVVMAPLSPTEAHVADLSGRGMSARKIAEELQLTVGAVRQRLAAIEQKRGSAAVPSLSR